MENATVYYATGRRKSAVAKTWMKPGNGAITVNKRPYTDYFPVESTKATVLQPLALTNNLTNFDITIQVLGGGIAGQAGAIRHGITRVLLQFDPELRQTLKKAGFVRRDPRVKERKKYGQRGARARFQFSKR